MKVSISGNFLRKRRLPPQFLKVMKLTAFLLTVVLLQVQAKSISQVTIKVKNVPIEKVFRQIEHKTGVGLIYTKGTLAGIPRVTLHAVNAPVKEVLKECFKGQSLEYSLENNTIVVVRKDAIAVVQQAGTIAVVPPPPPIEIKGRVIDAQGNPLVGVSVIVFGTTTGTTTNSDGGFSITAADSRNVTLEFSSVGYLTKKISTGKQTEVTVVLEAEDKGLDEVVVIGYGEVKKRDLTGSVGSLQSGDVVKGHPLSIQEALQGKLTGVSVAASSGEPGAAISISIRGSNTIYGGASPLYVIDGIPYDINNKEVATTMIDGEGYGMANPLATLNPQDIESVDILKDASATAIYGAMGANGVIIITTKSGKAGRLKIGYTGTATLSDATKKMNVLNAKDYIEYRRLLNPNTSLFYKDTNKDGLHNELDDPIDPYSFPAHDWQKEILRRGQTIDHNISVSGGRDGTVYGGSVGYVSEKTILIANNFDRYNFRLKLDHTQNRFEIGLGAIIGYTESKGPNNLGVVQSLSTARPLEYFNEGADLVDKYISPIAMITKSYRNRILVRTNLTGYIGYKFTNNFSFKNTLGLVQTSSKGKEFYNSETAWGREYKGVAIIQDVKSNSYRNTSLLNYTKKFSKRSTVLGMVGIEISRYNFENFSITNSYYLDETSGVDDISKGAKFNNITSSRDINTMISYFGRVTFNYNRVHLFTATYRADGSDKFGSENRFGYFPSFAYAWNVSKEKFLTKISNINDIKLRVSYGKTGNERIPSFRYLGVLENAYYNGQLGLAPATMANPNLKWETTHQYNLGLDASILNSRILFNIDMYYKRTDDMLLPAYVPSRTGYVQQWQNLGLISNKGIEFAINTVNVKRKDTEWSTNFNISFNKNIVIDIGNVGFINVSIPHAIKDQGRVKAGGSIGDFYGFVFDGIYQIDDFNWQENSNANIPHENRSYALKNGIVRINGVDVKPGSFKFKDLNNDGIVDLDNDRKIIGRSSPKHYGGFNNTLTYKKFDLNVLFDWSYGNQLFNLYRFQFEGGLYGTWQNILQDFWENRWTPDNPTNRYGDIAQYNLPSRYSSTYYIEDASWLRLKNVTLGYRFPTSQGFNKKLGFSSLRVFFSGTYIFTWTKYSGFYPEVSSNNPLIPGVDRISFPRARNYLFGISALF